jgi:hypothetical protein
VTRERQLDERVAGDVEKLARWWTSATQEARFELLRRSTKENSPPFQTLRLAIILSECEAGEVAEG